MCLLIHKPADAEMSNELILDVYTKNNDGFGIMFAENGKIEVIKTLASPEEIIKLYDEHCIGRECILHFRMQTHGDVDLDNCHPYRVTDDIWMAHNGVLSCSNPVDPKKSDTWHFIEYILRPILQSDPEKLFDEDFQDFISSTIGGSNKFGFMCADGRTVILNERSGVHHMGMWLSNTYAWSPSKFGYYERYKSSTTYGSSWYNRSLLDDYTAEHGDTWGSPSYTKDKVVPLVGGKELSYRKVCKAAYNCWRRGSEQLVDWVIAAPHKAKFFLQQWYEVDAEDVEELVDADPEEAARWIEDAFTQETFDRTHADVVS